MNTQTEIAKQTDIHALATLMLNSEYLAKNTKVDEALLESFLQFHIESPHELAIVGYYKGELMGLCFGSNRMEAYGEAFTEHVRQNIWQIIRRNPLAFFKRGKGSNKDEVSSNNPIPIETNQPKGVQKPAYIINVTVGRSGLDKELGGAMLTRFTEEMSTRGCDYCTMHSTKIEVSEQRSLQAAGFVEVARQNDHLLFAREI